MAIRKQEFYEGAALHLIARTGLVTALRYDIPFFIFNDRLAVLMKYSTKNRSPWSFTFTSTEQALLADKSSKIDTAIVLICATDGIAAVRYEPFQRIAQARGSAIHISCYRQHGEHYEVNGPDGTLPRKVSPSSWQKLLEQ